MKRRILALLIACLTGLGVAYAALMPQRSAPLVLPKIESIVVEKAARRMRLYSGGQLVHVISGLQFGASPKGHKQFEGDEHTPEGRYTIDTRNAASAYHLSLHISYPRPEDTDFARAQGRSPGGQIFIHGQPNSLPFGRAPGDWTNGCIAVSNAEIEALYAAVPDGASIEILP